MPTSNDCIREVVHLERYETRLIRRQTTTLDAFVTNDRNVTEILSAFGLQQMLRREWFDRAPVHESLIVGCKKLNCRFR